MSRSLLHAVLCTAIGLCLAPGISIARSSNTDCFIQKVTFDQYMEIPDARALVCQGVLFVPIESGAHAYDPLSKLIGFFGASFRYNGPTMSILINQPGKLIRMSTSGTSIMGDYGNDRTLTKRLLEHHGDLYIPLRFVLEKLGTSHVSGQVARRPDGAFTVHLTATSDPTPQPT